MGLDKIIINVATIILIMVAVSFSKRSPYLAALIISLPITTLIAMCIRHLNDRQSEGFAENMAQFSAATFWYVLPSLPMFLIMPPLFRRGLPFYLTLAIGCAITALLYYLTMMLLKKYAGMEL